MRGYIIDTWHQGTHIPVIRGVVNVNGHEDGAAVMRWFHEHTPFSMHEALTSQGYAVKLAQGWSTQLTDHIDSRAPWHLRSSEGPPLCGTKAGLSGYTQGFPEEWKRACRRCVAALFDESAAEEPR